MFCHYIYTHTNRHTRQYTKMFFSAFEVRWLGVGSGRHIVKEEVKLNKLCHLIALSITVLTSGHSVKQFISMPFVRKLLYQSLSYVYPTHANRVFVHTCTGRHMSICPCSCVGVWVFVWDCKQENERMLLIRYKMTTTMTKRKKKMI